MSLTLLLIVVEVLVKRWVYTSWIRLIKMECVLRDELTLHELFHYKEQKYSKLLMFWWTRSRRRKEM